MKKDFDNRNFIKEREAIARELRAKARGYPGLENPFALIQEGMLRDFSQSAMIDHPGDKGTTREDILRDFFTKKRYLPSRFGVSTGSSHVVSSSSSMSAQMDLVLYDQDNSPRLLDMGDIQYFPVECVYGVLEVKSDLNSKERVFEGLDRVASFKKLYDDQTFHGQPSPYGFGILFSYDASMKWATLYESVKEWQTGHPGSEWPNMVVVLNQGLLLQADDVRTYLHSEDIAKLKNPQLHPVPGDDSVLLHFYLLLMDLLTSIRLPHFSPRRYVALPARVDGRVVKFTRGAMSEVGTCAKHGTFLRELRPGAAERIVNACADQETIHAWKAVDKAYGRQDKEASADPGPEVLIYNPEKHSLSDVLLVDQKLRFKGKTIEAAGMAFEELTIDGRFYWVPQYYVLKHELVSGCGECPRLEIPQFSVHDWRRTIKELSAENTTDGEPRRGRSKE